jgi:DNA mismatch repair protein MutL
MDPLLADKIAAGEVIERIASVIKELVENSIDAKSKNIIVDLVDSGVKQIRVNDDGVGMDKEDALLCFQRHATSKIKNEDDLFFINTLGFRGEALASIAAVSKVDMMTSQGNVGTHIQIEGGKVITNEDAASRVGTIIEVNDLFYNTPARLKYLKSEQTELSHVTSFIERISFANPEISFTLTNNDRRIVYTSGSGDLLKTIHEIYGYSVSSNMIEINASSDDFDIHGYICRPTILKSSKSHMTTLVNNRIVNNIDLNRAINDGYFTFKPDIKYPVVVIKIETDPTLIDVNIHPSKADIKFSKFAELQRLVTKTIGEALRRTLLIQREELGVNINKDYSLASDIESVVAEPEEDNSNVSQMDFKDLIVQENMNFDEIKEKVEESSDTSKKINQEIKLMNLEVIGVALACFIIASNEEGLFIIDQHAAHERYNYEKVVREFKERKINTIDMLVPITMELSKSDFIKIKEHLNVFTEYGFGVEEFGINTFIVKSHPTWLREGREEELIKSIFDLIIDERDFDPVRFNNRVCATIACKASVRANEPITIEQAKHIVESLKTCDQPYNCPHGRPTIIEFSLYELEKMFKRVM